MQSWRLQIGMRSLPGARHVTVRAAAAALIAALPASAGAGQEPRPVLEIEEPGTEVLAPFTPHRLFLSTGDGFTIVDGRSRKVEGVLYAGAAPVIDVAPEGRRIFVAETYFSRGNRGTRVDLVSIYDGRTLELLSEIPVPGRLIAGGRSNYFALSGSGRRAYVYDFDPATKVHVVDTERRRLLSTIEIPGCGLVYPVRDDGFATLCADGSIAFVPVDTRGRGEIIRSAPVFDAERDPVFEESLVDRQTGEGLLVTLTGRVIPASLGREIRFGEPWSLQQAAGLAPATTGVQHRTWRPGGRRPFAFHRASGRLFVLMHEGKHWSHYDPGTEVWVVDVGERRVVARHPLPTAGRLVGVSEGEDPLLFVAGEGDWLWVLEPASGKILGQLPEIRRPGMIRTSGL